MEKTDSISRLDSFEADPVETEFCKGDRKHAWKFSRLQAEPRYRDWKHDLQTPKSARRCETELSGGVASRSILSKAPGHAGG